MGIANYTSLSELMIQMMKNGAAVSIADLAEEAQKRRFILASEGELADRADLENGFIALFDQHCRAGAIQPRPSNETEAHLIQLYKSGKLAENGYGGGEGDQFIRIKWIAMADTLPVIVNINL